MKTASQLWKDRFRELPQTDSDKLAVAMMAEYAEQHAKYRLKIQQEEYLKRITNIEKENKDIQFAYDYAVVDLRNQTERAIKAEIQNKEMIEAIVDLYNYTEVEFKKFNPGTINILNELKRLEILGHEKRHLEDNFSISKVQKLKHI